MGNEAACYAALIGTSTSPLNPFPRSCRMIDEGDGGVQDSEDTAMLGVTYVFTYLFLSDVGSVISEKFLQAEKKTPFHVQKVALEVCGLPWTILMSFVVPIMQRDLLGDKPAKYMPRMWWLGSDCTYESKGQELPCGFAAGGLYRDWGHWQIWLALFMLTAQSWVSGLLVKIFSSVTKLLGKVVSVAAVYFIADLWLNRPTDAYPISFGGTVAAVQVMIGTYCYLGIPQEKKKDEPKDKREIENRRPSQEVELPTRKSADPKP